ncbi:MAG: Xaa-Pro dipeptidase [Polyangiaceae bacterium]
MTTGTFAPLYRAHVDDLVRRYAPILEDAGLDALVIHSGAAKTRTDFDDQFWSVRPTPHYQHWLPLADPDSFLLVEPGKTPLLLWATNASFWENLPAPESDEFTRVLRVERIDGVEGAKKRLQELVPNLGASPRAAFVGEFGDRARTLGFDPADGTRVNPKPLLGALDRLRATKTPYEVACLDEANVRSARGHAALRDAFAQGDKSELELHLLYLAATRQDDPETPYKNIVALDENAATLHHVSYGRVPKHSDAQALLVDAGATCLGYCSDITRTWVKGKGATASAFAGLVLGVEAMQKRLCDAVRVGEPYEGLHDECHRQVAAILEEVGILKVTADEAVANGLTRAFLPHGLGHSLGLQCHDVGCALIKPRVENPWLRNTSTIREGQVFTIEPGIYFIEALLAPHRTGAFATGVDWKLTAELAKLGGVRIEDDLVVTGGNDVTKNLTRAVLPVGGALL